MMGLNAENTGQLMDDSQLVELQETGHDGGDVTGIADWNENTFILEVPVKPLGALKCVGFLAEDAPCILGVEQGHAVVVCEVFNNLHAVIKYTWDFQHDRAGAKRLGELGRGDLAMGQNDNGFDSAAHIGSIQGSSGRSVAGGCADGQNLIPAVFADKCIEIGEAARHAAILEGRGRILSVIFVGGAEAGGCIEAGAGFNDGRVAFTKVHDILFIQYRSHQLVEAEDTAQGGFL